MTGKLKNWPLHRAMPFLWSMMAVGGAGAVAVFVERTLPLPNLSLVFLLAVLMVAVSLGTVPALITAVLSVIVYNFFFTHPYFTFSVSQDADVLTLLFFVLVAAVTGNVAGYVRRQLVEARRTARRNAVLYEFSSRVAAATGIDDVLWAVCHHVSATLGEVRSLVLMPGADDARHLCIAAGYPPEDRMSGADWTAAERSWQQGRIVGAPLGIPSESSYLFIPLKTGRGPVAVIGIAFGGDGQSPSSDQRRLLDAVADQSAVAIERTLLARDVEQARLLAETENLRSALLSSISHDLRTPLVSIIGSATTLSSVEDAISPDDRHDLVGTILDEAQRLNRFVQNLLDMSRLSYGALKPRRDWVDAREIVGGAVHRLRDTLKPFDVDVTVGPDVPLLYVDPVLMEQVLVNLLDNAAKFSPEGGRIGVDVGRRGDQVDLQVKDEGPGIPPAERELVFDMFYRVKAGDARTAGTGLGLSICKGLVEAHGGSIRAQSGPGGRGAVMAIVLPAYPQPAETAEDAEP
ncbi:sensor histidine kinase [Shumkonia mesophila]|uniref:sensor histidine kinase n=1 Tax=Shumkonia mesophila TaxID=2838854 RepID=UPI0029349A19|nr:ATP-binding protein [Shumkonia mesophila]